MEKEIKRTYYKNGQLKCETPCLNGKNHGVEMWWHDNGHPKQQFPMINGELYGTYKFWYFNGTCDCEVQYKNRLEQGVRIDFNY